MIHVQLFNRLSRRTVFWIGLVLLVSILFAAARSPSPPDYTYHWANVRRIGSTAALRPAAFVQSGFIWDASWLDAPLAYTPLEQINRIQPLLDYPGLAPQLWQTASAQNDSYHLIWLDQNQRLYSALLDTEGQTRRGPIELAPRASSFIALPYGEDRVFTAWINNSNLFAGYIDYVGRPRPLLKPLLENVSIIAGVADRESELHLAWLGSISPGSWAVNYQMTTPDNVTLESFTTLLTFQLDPDEIITSFTMGLDQSHGYVFWGLTSADQPDVERVFTSSFPLDQPADVQFTELTLPAQFEPDNQLPPSDFALGPVAVLPAESSKHAKLRWPRSAPGQHALLPLAITMRIDAMWYPAVVYYQSGKALGYQIVATLPANAGPPSLVVDPGSDLHLAWTGLQGAIPTLFIASTEGQGLIREKAEG